MQDIILCKIIVSVYIGFCLQNEQQYIFCIIHPVVLTRSVKFVVLDSKCLSGLNKQMTSEGRKL